MRRTSTASQALDDNTLKNYSGKATASLSANQKLMFSYLWNDKIRGHRRDTPPNNVPDIAAVVQTNPAQTTQVKYTGVRQRSSSSRRSASWTARPTTAISPARRPTRSAGSTSTLSTADFAAARNEEQPNSRHQFDNVVLLRVERLGRRSPAQGRRPVRRGCTASRATPCRAITGSSTPTATPPRSGSATRRPIPRTWRGSSGSSSRTRWSVARRLTLNLGLRFDRYQGILPEQSNPGGTFIAARSIERARSHRSEARRVAHRRVVRPDRQTAGPR